MEETDKTKEELLRQVEEMRRAIAKLEACREEQASVAEELKESEEKFRKLAEKSVVGIYLIQDDFLRYVNPKFAEIFGYEVDEMVNRLEATEIVFLEDRPLIEENIRKRISGEVESIHFQFRGIRKDQKIIYVEVYGSRIDHQGRPAVLGTMIDITERIHAQRDLEKQLTIFQGLYDLAMAMIAERSLDENLTLVVEKSRQILGTDTSFIALHDEKKDELRWHISSGLVTERFKRLRVRMGKGLAGKVAQSGKWIVVEDYFKEIGYDFQGITRDEGLISGIAVPIRIGQTNYGVLFAFNRTKTQFSKTDLDTLLLFGNIAAVEIARKRAQELLQESEERYKNLYEESKRREDLYLSFLNSSADAIMVYDLEGKTQYVSPSFVRLFGWTEEEVKGGRIPFVPESERDSEKDLFQRVVGEGEAVRDFQTKRNTKDGSTLDVSISASCYHDYDGNPAGVSVILRDVTALKSIERTMRRAVDHLSHELRTPLVIIQASVQQLNRHDLTEKQKEQTIERIQRHLDRLGDLQTIVQRILLPQKYQPQLLQVDIAIEGIIDMLRKKSAHRQVKILTRLEAIETDVIDPHMLEQILRTLVKNAVENTPDGGEIIIALTHHPMGVMLQVQDHGVGITASDREFIFDAFYHTQETDQYSTRKPFDFDAGGKGLELMHLKILSEGGAFDISFESRRCYYLSTRLDQCCGKITSCPYISDLEGCKKSGGTTFSVLFHRPRHREVGFRATGFRSASR
jgi:two-component system phosphate regulon sensor histidine kinase PhoR